MTYHSHMQKFVGCYEQLSTNAESSGYLSLQLSIQSWYRFLLHKKLRWCWNDNFETIKNSGDFWKIWLFKYSWSFTKSLGIFEKIKRKNENSEDVQIRFKTCNDHHFDVADFYHMNKKTNILLCVKYYYWFEVVFWIPLIVLICLYALIIREMYSSMALGADVVSFLRIFYCNTAWGTYSSLVRNEDKDNEFIFSNGFSNKLKYSLHRANNPFLSTAINFESFW